MNIDIQNSKKQENDKHNSSIVIVQYIYNVKSILKTFFQRF